ncbi:MAG: fimbrillin family protein [Bacteroidales bacterium]|nr:fimbrillin family protein [Bacteroidales bacterium]
MKRLFFIFGGLMLLALTACVNEKISIEDQFAGEKITVKAYMPEGNTPSTRVSYTLNDDGNPETNDPFVLSWSDGDAFSVIRGGENKIFTKSEGANDFTGTLPTAGSGDYYAVYPKTLDANHERVLFDISMQEKLPYLMYTSSATGESFNFKHALAYLKLNISFPSALYGEEDLLYIQLPESSDEYFCPGGYLNISNGQVELTADHLYYGGFIFKPVTFSNDGTSIEVMIAIPPIPQMTDPNRNKLYFSLDRSYNGVYYGAELKRTNNEPIVAGNYYTASIELVQFE